MRLDMNRINTGTAIVQIVMSMSILVSRFSVCECFTFQAKHANVRRQAFSSRRSSNTESRMFASPPQNVAVVGGGLAGLSTVYHLLEKIDNVQITVLDKALPGQGGASSVAGGLLHPFSPRGKLIHLGMEGLETTNRLLAAAKKHSPSCIVRDKIFRIALAEKNVDQLKQTADLNPQFATWLDSDEIKTQCGTQSLGGVVLTNGCQVVHVPSYLEGLWEACKELPNGDVTWSLEDLDDSQDLETRLSSFDTVVFSAGSGLFHNSILCEGGKDTSLPVDLVRGQSVEMLLTESDTNDYPNEAILCGKYLAPMPASNQILIGATHEYKEQALDQSEVFDELKNRSYDLSPFVWDKGSVQKVTSGYRVQSRRGKFGRMPIIGQLQDCDVHNNAYLFTGLSARGLIYHGIYGDLLSTAIANQNEEVLLENYPDVLWWKQ